MATLVKQERPAAVTPRSSAELLIERYAEVHQLKAEIADAYKASVAPLDDELNELKTKLQAWCEEHEAEFKGKKTLDLPSGTMGYKLGLKSVVFPLEGPENVKEQYLNIVKKELPGAIVEGVDSKKVVDGWAFFPKLVSKLGKLGITVSQKDNFYITPKK